MERNEAQKYGVSIIPAVVLPPSTHYWKAVLVRKLSVGENGGRHNIYVDVWDEKGLPCRGRQDILVAWGWEGQRVEEKATPKHLDKPDGEPMAVIDLYPRAKTWVQLITEGTQSERVQGFTSALPDEGPDVTYGHHSYYVRFQRVPHEITFAPPVVDGSQPATPQTIRLAVIEAIVGTRFNEALDLITQDLKKIGFA